MKKAPATRDITKKGTLYCTLSINGKKMTQIAKDTNRLWSMEQRTRILGDNLRDDFVYYFMKSHVVDGCSIQSRRIIVASFIDVYNVSP